MLQRCLGYVLAALFAGPLCAADRAVELLTSDGQVMIAGDLVEQDGDFFRVLTKDGPVTVDAGALRCVGVGCPSAEAMLVTSSIAGPPDLLTELVAPLMSGFAASRGLTFSEQFLSDTRSVWTIRDAVNGRDVARIEAGDIERPDLRVSRRIVGSETLADILALDAVVAVVAPENPVATVSTPTLKLMLTGRVKTWPELLTGRFGVEAEEVRLHLPEDLASLGRIWPFEPVRPPSSARRYFDPDTLADAVAADPGALGVVPLSRLGNTTRSRNPFIFRDLPQFSRALCAILSLTHNRKRRSPLSVARASWINLSVASRFLIRATDWQAPSSRAKMTAYRRPR